MRLRIVVRRTAKRSGYRETDLEEKRKAEFRPEVQRPVALPIKSLKVSRIPPTDEV
jgi:hypothetical protein